MPSGKFYLVVVAYVPPALYLAGVKFDVVKAVWAWLVDAAGRAQS